jgi:hypothetical protein
MFIGARVAYIIGDKARLGVITSLGEDRHAIMLDGGNTVPVNPDRLRLANYWKDRTREKDVDTLRTYPRDTDALEIFRDKHGVLFGVAAMRSMWYWSNVHVFNNKLVLPKLVVSSNRSKYGSYKLDRGKRRGTLMASARNHNLQELFATLLHEMIHQYNFEIEWLQEHIFDPQYEGSHGHAFLKWLPIIQAKTGVKITITADPTQDVTIFDDRMEDEPTTEPFIFALVKPQDKWSGFVLKDKLDLTIFTGELGSALQRMIHNKDSNVYAGISKLRRVKQEFQNVRNGRINPHSLKNLPSSAVVKLAVSTAKPLDGWDLPALDTL